MTNRGINIELTRATKLHNFLYVSGNAEPNTGNIRKINLLSSRFEITQQSSLSPFAGKIDSHKKKVEFVIQALFDFPFDLQPDVVVSLFFESGEVVEAPLTELITDQFAKLPTNQVYKDFCDQIRGHTGAKVLDLGGRDRQKVDVSRNFPGVDFTVLDIVPSENVDVVGDAHELSKFFPKNTFDYILSLSVFEHLAMPWKVATEMNKVLKMGGMALVQAPQSCGMHDLPWDFWRFSDAAWSTIFNERTGFRVVAQFRDAPNYVLPFFLRREHLDAEKAAGFEVSMVIVQKIAENKEAWKVELAMVAVGSYPV